MRNMASPIRRAEAVHRWQMMVARRLPWNTLTILPCERLAGHFDWAIRRHGQLVERSDRHYPSEQAPRETASGA